MRSEIIIASCSAMAAMMWIVRRFACGKSTASNSTFDSIKLEMNATLRAKRSSLAMTSLVLGACCCDEARLQHRVAIRGRSTVVEREP